MPARMLCSNGCIPCRRDKSFHPRCAAPDSGSVRGLRIQRPGLFRLRTSFDLYDIHISRHFRPSRFFMALASSCRCGRASALPQH